ncbi:iron ABC transporter permease [bacterium]|nr:iron ABC transporter permease [bacterium]
MKRLTFHRWIFYVAISLLALIATIAISITIGSEEISLREAISDPQSSAHAILFFSRLPRVLLAVLVGIALASSGGTFQALLRNPLADPFILGVSGGAALGSVLAVGLSLPFFFVSTSAFLMATLTMFLIYWIAQTKGRLPSHTLLLTGVIFNAFSFALIMFVNSIVTIEQAHEILFILIGSLDTISYSTLIVVATFVLVGFFTLTMFSYQLNILSLGDETSHYLGLNINAVRKVIFFAASLMVGASVAVSGLIGFVGLFIPHMVRLIFGPDHRLLIPLSGILGGVFLALSDTVARTILANSGFHTQIPVGVITALIGGPFFVYLLKREQKV